MYYYLRDKPPEMKQAVWLTMEEVQEKTPYLELGWFGFLLCVVYR